MISLDNAFNAVAINRDQFISLLRAALSIDESRFARQAALAWLGSFPGDLQVNLHYAQALTKAGQPDRALPVLDHISQCDPEYLEAIEALVQAQAIQQFQTPSENKANFTSPTIANPIGGQIGNQIGWLMALGGSPDIVRGMGLSYPVLREKSLVGWSRALSKARQAFEQGELEQAEREIHEALPAEGSTPLVDVIHLRILNARMRENNTSSQMLRSLAAYYRQRWPDCIHFTLLLADALMGGGEPEKAVALLHEAAAGDVAGQVAIRLWGANHPYRSLWPDRLEIDLDLPIPASVSAILGWNRLPESIGLPEMHGAHVEEADLQPPTEAVAEAASAKNQPKQVDSKESQSKETLRSVQSELERLGVRLNRPSLASADGRFPVYVIMTTREGLQKRYGEQTAAILETEMLRLVAAIRERRDWGALLFYADEGVVLSNGSQSNLDRPATRANDPWGLKLALMDLDMALRKYGERIGCLLIVGGPDVVPFHNLPNPVDDADIDVPSDNPYGTSDENYFIPEWPVGRLPDGIPDQEANAQPMLYTLSGLTARHKSIANGSSRSAWYRRWIDRMIDWITHQGQNVSYKRSSFGITAAVWRQASLTVFRPIGDPRAMRISPPTINSHPSSNGRYSSPMPTARLGYFNLHGLADAPEWYGQREAVGEDAPILVGVGEDYPVALKPSDVMNSGRAPQVVFSEACYGANILNKTIDDAMSLKFIQAGTHAVAGSTCTSYGSISPPLIAADFLGYAFWNNVKEGLPAGEALRRAKITLAREMHNRQGYLDGEDQKTLISFILYGDPMAVPAGIQVKAKSVLRSVKPPSNLKTVCDRSHEQGEPEPVPDDIQEFVKSVVRQYLPGMEDARLTMSLEHVDCGTNHPIRHSEGSHSQKRPDSASARQGFQLARKVITLSKEVPNTAHIHHHYARLTLDAQGKLVKLVVSR